ncbi:MAG: DNA/RNA helicase domain-containing protein [Lachnospiraceae bacterium]
MYKITEGDFSKQKFSDDEYLDNWPMLYILENGKQAYIGESNHVKKRMSQHKRTVEKSIFEKVHFIYSKEFNQSVTFDYEAKLIAYIAADELYEVTNGNAGLADKSYYNKNHYDKKFQDLWKKLQKEGLVKHSLEEIEDSDLFKYSPFKKLNDDQRDAVETILSELKPGVKKTIVVNGMPGSGKTIVAVFLMKYLKDNEEFKDKKIGFVVPQTSLRKTMKKIFKSIYGLKSADIIAPSDATRIRYDVLIVDEAHRLHQYKNISYMGPFKKSCERIGLTTESDELDWIMHQCDCPILFYDRLQVVGPSGIDIERFSKKMEYDSQQRVSKYFKLSTQMRVRGGNDYIGYIESLLQGKQENKIEFNNYKFGVFRDFKAFEELMYKLERIEGLTRMISGYGWDWSSKKDATKYDIEIQGVKRKWNHCTEGWVHSKKAIDEIGCIHSIQGYDLNYAFVIFGREISYDPNTKQLIVNRSLYFDENGKKTTTDDELLGYIKDIYYVLLSRGIKGTYIYAYNEALQEYLANFMDVVR